MTEFDAIFLKLTIKVLLYFRAKARLENAKLLLDVPVQLRNVKVQETHKLMRVPFAVELNLI